MLSKLQLGQQREWTKLKGGPRGWRFSENCNSCKGAVCSQDLSVQRGGTCLLGAGLQAARLAAEGLMGAGGRGQAGTALQRERCVKAAKSEVLTNETKTVLWEKGQAEQERARLGLIWYQFPPTLQLIPAVQDSCSPLLWLGAAGEWARSPLAAVVGLSLSLLFWKAFQF